MNLSEASDEQLEGIRAYLAHCYIATSSAVPLVSHGSHQLTLAPSPGRFTVAWRKYKNLSPILTSWTMTCADILQRHALVDGDVALATLIRFASIASDASSAIHERQGQTEQQRRLVMLGLETQVQALQQQIPADIATNGAYPAYDADPIGPWRANLFLKFLWRRRGSSSTYSCLAAPSPGFPALATLPTPRLFLLSHLVSKPALS